MSAQLRADEGAKLFGALLHRLADREIGRDVDAAGGEPFGLPCVARLLQGLSGLTEREGLLFLTRTAGENQQRQSENGG
jgi:hypothetical protein